ncbi:MAG: DUF6801 domain-containing protein [Marmoricola sp.]
MTTHPRRLASVSVALAGLFAAGLVGSSPVGATTGTMAYNCEAPGIGSQALNFVLDTNAPAKMYVGRTISPKLTVKVTIPGFVIGLAKFAGVYYADATGVVNVGVNGRTVKGNAVYPYTKLPDGNADFPVNLPVPLPPLKPTAAGTIRYTPGPLTATLSGYDNHANKADATKVGDVTAHCTVKTKGRVIDTIKVVKSPTVTGAPLTYTKATKQVVSSITVAASSGITPYGKVTSVLYRGKTKIKSVTKTLAQGAATTAFGGVSKKGSYKVVTTYSGSGAHLKSTRTKAFTVS